jgi:alkaline phosphatase D
MDRRRFLGGLALAGVTAACANEGDGSTTTEGGASGAADVVAAAPTGAELPEGIFALGVASGDPLPDAVMLWTRLAADPLAADGGAPTGEVEVAYDVATDDSFSELVASGIAVARPEMGHALHVDVSGLEPDTWYVYRFRAGGRTSPVGRTRTFPSADATPEDLRFVFASCQDYQWGYYGAWGRVAEEPDLDVVVFLGDYIYELNLGDLSPDGSGTRVWAGPEPVDLEGYRRRYAQTKSDPQLQAAHEMAPWIVTWDDHEVSNNYAGDVAQADVDTPASRERRLAAYQAWYEHTPVRIDPEPEDFDELPIHREFTYGELASFFVIETRQHADAPACRVDGSLVADEGPSCEALESEDRSNLGEEQEQWLIDGLSRSDTTWNILANPIMLAGLNVGTAEEPEITRDAWDGYPATRQRLLEAITTSEVPNPVVVTGDWHASFVLDVAAEPGGPTVMPEFLASSISTVLFDTDYRPNNPHVRYFVAEHGYAVVTVTPDDLRCDFRYITDVWDPDSPIGRTDSWVLAEGERTPEPA